MKKNHIHTLVIVVLVSLLAVVSAAAQGENELKLSMARNFGYSSGGGSIQGTFTMKAGGPQDLEQVTFFIDDQVLGEDSEAPFELRFHTDNYPLGRHKLWAVGKTGAGQELHSNEINAIFVTAEEGWQAGLRIAGPVLGIVLVISLLSILLSFTGAKQLNSLPPGAARKYGAAGGAICSRCGRPFPRHFMAPNMVVGKLERCPYCGKVAIVRARSMVELRAAEAAEIVDARTGNLEVEESEEDRLRKQIEESRYQ